MLHVEGYQSSMHGVLTTFTRDMTSVQSKLQMANDYPDMHPEQSQECVAEDSYGEEGIPFSQCTGHYQNMQIKPGTAGASQEINLHPRKRELMQVRCA